MQVVALNGEHKGNEHIITKHQHMTKFLTYDIPSCQHFFLIPEIIKDIKSSYKLITPHSQSDKSKLFLLFAKKCHIQHQPKQHSHSVCIEFYIERTDSRVELSPDPKIHSEAAMRMMVNVLTHKRFSHVSLQIQEGTHQQCEYIHSGPKGPKFICQQ